MKVPAMHNREAGWQAGRQQPVCSSRGFKTSAQLRWMQQAGGLSMPFSRDLNAK